MTELVQDAPPSDPARGSTTRHRLSLPLTPDGGVRIAPQPFSWRRGSDLYHVLGATSWPQLFAVIVAVYLAGNVLFAGLYLAGGDVIANARPGSFADAFFFSVQTMSTIGYGTLAPVGGYAHVIVTVEAFFGLLFAAVVTGLVFSKFARPTARVLFTERAVVGTFEGTPTLMFRMANERTSGLVEAQVRVSLVVAETTDEGRSLRRFHDLPLLRSTSPVFALSWTAFHPIDASSPLFGESAETLRDKRAALVVTLTGIEDTLAQVVHARHVYFADSIAWDSQLADVLSATEDGWLELDMARFHEVVAEP